MQESSTDPFDLNKTYSGQHDAYAPPVVGCDQIHEQAKKPQQLQLIANKTDSLGPQDSRVEEKDPNWLKVTPLNSRQG